MSKHIVSVYGTLKSGFGNHRLLEQSKFLGKSIVRGTMYSLGGYPAVVLGGTEAVHVEVYEVDDDTLVRLDRLEGTPNFYQRSTTYIPSYGHVNIYTMNEGSHFIAKAPKVESGNWGNASG